MHLYDIHYTNANAGYFLSNWVSFLTNYYFSLGAGERWRAADDGGGRWAVDGGGGRWRWTMVVDGGGGRADGGRRTADGERRMAGGVAGADPVTPAPLGRAPSG